MKKKGFTLIELLAVIVILAIIALISVPIILNMIDSAKKSGAISSTYGYIEAVENYQAMEEVEGNTGLEEGTYNVATKTNDISKINDLVKLKGKKPTNGTISINKEKSVTGANLCMNGYIVRYINKEAEIISSDCDELGIITEYSLDKEGWQKKRELTIRYPNGDYKYYYKVTGNAKEGENTITKNTDIETTKEVTITLLENQTVETWLVKNSKITGKDSYKEEKIDNVEIVEPVGTIKIGYPILTENGVESSAELEITSTQEGTSPYYSLDNGATWIKYTKKTTVNKSKVKIKMVRDLSKRESSIKEAQQSSETITDTIGPEAYDGDEDTYYMTPENKNYYLNIDDSAVGKSIYILLAAEYANRNISILDENKNPLTFKYNQQEVKLIDNFTELDSTGQNYKKLTKIIEIPTKAKYIQFQYSGMYIYEIGISTAPTYEWEEKVVYPTLTENGIEDYDDVTITYSNTSIQKLYKIDDGNWLPYQNKAVKVSAGRTLYMKGIDKNGKDTFVRSYKPIRTYTDAITFEAYDGDEDTYYITPENNNYYLNVDNSAVGKTFRILVKAEYPNRNITILDENKNPLTFKCDQQEVNLISGLDSNYQPKKLTKIIEIPTKAKYIQFQYSDIYIYEIGIYE